MKALDTERRSDPPPLPLLQVAPVFAAPRSLGKSGRRSRICRYTAPSSARKVPAEASKRRLTEKFLSFLILRWTKPLFAGSIYGREQKGVKRPDALCVGFFPYEGAKPYLYDLYAWLFLSSREVTPRNSRYCASVGLRINRDRGAAARKMRKKIPPVKGRR